MDALTLLARRTYKRAPLSLKQICRVMPYPLMAGRHYRRTLALCRRLDRLSRGQIRAFQERELARLLQFAVAEVPFYRRYAAYVEKYPPFDALRSFPLISKSIVNEHFEELIPGCVDSLPHRRTQTSGSSGNMLVFLEDASTYAREMGYMHAQWYRVKYTPRSRKATFRDTLSKLKPGMFWRANPIHNELQFSPFYMSENCLGTYMEKFLRYRPEYVHGYPSAVDALAEYVLRQNLGPRLPVIKAALLGSEPCSVSQRQRIIRAFNTRVYTWYGHSERVVLAGECECSECYHAFPSYGFLEVLREDGAACREGEEGEIVGTGFLNRSMPLIRYRTDDYAVKHAPSCACGRQWDRFSQVRGRRTNEGYVLSKSGAKISSTALETPSQVFCHVIRFQYYQNKPGELRIRLMPNPNFSAADEQAIKQAHQCRLGAEMDVEIDLVNAIPLTRAGKQRWLISDVDPQKLNRVDLKVQV